MKLFYQICLLTLLLIGCSTKKESSPKKVLKEKPQTTQKSFDYQPLKPVNGELKAVIELGSLGLNYFIISIDEEGRWELKKANFGRSNIIYGVSSDEEIVATIIDFKKEILQAGVANKNIHLIASSSVVQIEDIEALSEKIRPIGLELVTVNSKNEARYDLIATMPKEFVKESFLVDVGSGNTKISWVSGSDTSSIEIHGSKYFLGDVQDTTVFREVRDALLQVPKENRNLCFMLGGMVHEFIVGKEIPGKRYYVLDSPSEYPVINEKSKAMKVIYNALYLAPTYSYIFDNESNFSIGYLISINNKK